MDKGASCSSPSWCGIGNWRLENNYVTENQGGDGYMFLFDNHFIEDHIVEAKVKIHDMGYGGLVVWRKDEQW